MIFLEELNDENKENFHEFIENYKADYKDEKLSYIFNTENKDFDEFFQEIMELSQNSLLSMGWVPSKFYLIKKDTEIAGILSIRMGDSDFILNYAGHIGYIIHPSFRRQGIGTQALKLALDQAKNLGMTKLLITCDPDNEGSKKVIINNKGRLENKNHRKEYYWIEL